VHAARVAARLRKELGIEAERVHGDYGEFRVLVDGKEVISAGPLGFLGALPPAARVVEAVRQAASSTGSSLR
jgi:hypothetical protein